MMPLATSVIEVATRALARDETSPLTEAVLSRYREDARAVVVAVLARLGGKKGEPGLLPYQNAASQQLLQMADEVEEEGADQQDADASRA